MGSGCWLVKIGLIRVIVRIFYFVFVVWLPVIWSDWFCWGFFGVLEAVMLVFFLIVFLERILLLGFILTCGVVDGAHFVQFCACLNARDRMHVFVRVVIYVVIWIKKLLSIYADKVCIGLSFVCVCWTWGTSCRCALRSLFLFELLYISIGWLQIRNWVWKDVKMCDPCQFVQIMLN